MKKYILQIIFIFIIILVGCRERKTKVPNEVLVTNKQISCDRCRINYPSMQKLPIDNYIKNEVLNLSDKLIEYYPENDIFINVNYESIKSDYATSFLFNFQILKADKIYREIKKAYNFSLQSNKKIVLNDNILNEVYLPLLNKKLSPYMLKLNINDLKTLKYIIQKDSIIFTIPKVISQKNDILIGVTNHGDEHVALIEKNQGNKRKLVALTFDDGPSKETINLVNLLNKYNIKATFFLLGQQVERYPQEVKYIYKHNHEIGNHSYSHPDFTKITLSEIINQIQETQEVIYKQISSYPKVFRFPYGEYNDFILKHINLPIILWNCDSEDWRYLNENIIIKNILKELSDNMIIIFHDFDNYRKVAIEKAIKYLMEEEYEFVTISELFDFYNDENIIFGKIYW